MHEQEVLEMILDKFNEAVARMSLIVSGERAYEDSYKAIRQTTIDAIKDNAHIIKPRETPKPNKKYGRADNGK